MLTLLGFVAGLAMSANHGQPAVPTFLRDHPGLDVRLSVMDGTATADRLWLALDLQAMMPILRDEAVQEAARLEAEGMIAGGGAPWAQVVGNIHDPVRLQKMFRAGMREAMTQANSAALEQGLRFYDEDLGRRLVVLETSARRAMLADPVKAQASAAFRQAVDRASPRAEQILRLIEEADLVAPNVASGLNASVAFSRGFAEGDGFDMPLTDPQILADAWAQQDQIEADATDWLQGFLMLAYSPLSDAELDTYIAYATSPGGQSLARVLFSAFDRVFMQTSYDMGLAAALRMQGRHL